MAHEVRTGDRFEVHYSESRPSDNVDRADDYFARFGASVIALVFLLAGVTALVWFRRKERRRHATVSRA